MSQSTWPSLAGALLSWAAGTAVMVMVGLAGPAAWAGAVVVVVAVVLTGVHWRDPSFGLANQVTLVRVVGTAWVGGLLAEAMVAGGDLPLGALVLMIITGTVCLVLDGVDGHVARSRKLVSDFGARFDMETDSALVMILSVAVPVVGIAGWWVVAIGAMRYLYAAASWLLPWLRIPLYYSYPRKVVAVVQGIALLAALLLAILPGPLMPLASPIVAIALGALCWSFGRDINWQWRRRNRTSAAV